MKANLSTLIILLITSLYSVNAQNVTCSYEDNSASAAYITLSENGYGHTPKGNLHMLLLYVTFIEDDILPNADALSPYWPKNGIPTYVSNGTFIDNNPLNPTTINNLTNWFKVMSKVPNVSPSTYKFSITGEAFQVQISNDISNLSHDPDRNRLDEIEHEFSKRAIAALNAKYPNEDWSRFDKRHNNPVWNFDNSIQNSTNPNDAPAVGDGQIDYLNICFRLSQSFIGNYSSRAGYGGYRQYSIDLPLQSITNSNGTFSFSDGHSLLYVMDYQTHFQYFLHEFAHVLYASPHYMGANSAAGNHYYQYSGWGMMGQISRTFLTANAWEKWYLGWAEPQTITQSGIYYLKDFVEGVDAIRLHIPATSPGSTTWYSNQYLWIENHQLLNYFDNKFQYTTEAPMNQGLYVYISDRDGKSGDVYTDNNRFKVLNASGRWDYDWVLTGNQITATTIADNPIGGQSSSEFIRADYNGDGQIPVSSEGGSLNESKYIQKLNNIPGAYWTLIGDDGFHVGDEISLSGKLPITNYPNFAEAPGRNGVDPYQIMGISVKVLDYDVVTRTYKLEIDLGDFELRNNKRWAAGGIDLNNISQNTNPDLIVKNGVVLTINKSGTKNRSTQGAYLNEPVNDLIKPTVFTCKTNSFLKLESNSTIQVYEGSTIKMEPNSKLEIENGAKLIISDNSKLDIASNAQIIVHPGGKIIIDDGSSLVFNPNVNITLHNNSFIEVAEFGMIEIAENATFTWSGKGYLKINTNTWGVSNIVATGPNAKFQKIGGGYAPFDEKLVEITGGGSLSVDKSLAEFKLQRGYVLMDEHTLLDVEPKMRCYFVKFTTNNANKKHAGIMVYGQQNEAYLDNCIVENAGWGILMLNNSGNATQAKIVATKFINNEIGVYIHGKGADLSYCTFWRNTHAAIQLDMLTLPANLYKINAEGNGNGLLSNATNFSLINITDSKIYQNLSGVEVTGGTLTVGCSKIYNNYGPNLHLKNQTTLGLEPARWAKTGNNYFYNDFTTSIELNNAWNLYMDKGKNHFKVNPNNSSQVINGTLRIASVWSQRLIFPIVASQNYWNINGTSPVMQTISASNDYLITQKYRTATLNIPIVDGSPLTVPPTFSDCTSGNSLPYNPGDQPSVLIGKPNLTLSNSVDIKDYFMKGLDKLYIQNNYDAAISIFELIVKHDYGTDNDIQLSDEEYISEQGLWSEVVYAAYEKMLESLTSGIYAGVISDYESATDLYNKVRLAQEHLIGNITAADALAYEHWFKLSLDNAIIYKLMGNLNTCYDKLNNLKAVSFHTSTNANLVNYTFCRIENEINLRDSAITKMDYAIALKNCISELGYNYPTQALNVGEEPADPIEEGYFGKKGNDANKSNSEPSQLVDEQSTDEVNVYPNPSNGLIIINANGVKVESVTIYNKLGMKVTTYNNTDTINISHSGLYILEIKTDKGTYRKKVVVQ